MPGFNGAKHSELAALVTDDPEKAQELGKKYDISEITDYDGYEGLLRHGNIDAVISRCPTICTKSFPRSA